MRVNDLSMDDRQTVRFLPSKIMNFERKIKYKFVISHTSTFLFVFSAPEEQLNDDGKEH